MGKQCFLLVRAGLVVFLIKNKYLKPVLAKYGLDTDDVWAIVKEEGSVQWIDTLSALESCVCYSS